MSQISVSVEQDIGKLGDAAEVCSPKDIVSRKNTSKSLPGKLCVPVSGSADQIKHPTSAAELSSYLGVVMHNDAKEEVDSSLPDHIPAKNAIAVMKRGRIFVVAEEAVNVGDDVYVRFKTKRQIQTLTFDADFVTGNTIVGFVGGEKISVPFTTDQATTIAALDAAIEGLTSILNVAVAGRVLTITSEVDSIADVQNFVVSGGASQAGAAVAETQEGRTSYELGGFRTSADDDEGSNATAAVVSGLSYTRNAVAGELTIIDIVN